MQTGQVRAYFLSRSEIIEDFPFGIQPTVLVRLKGKFIDPFARRKI